MNESIALLVIGVKMTEKMDEKDIYERVEEARKVGKDITPIVQETEMMTVEVLDEIVKPDEVLDEKDIVGKAKMYLELINHNYGFFEIDQPYNTDVSDEEVFRQLEEIRGRDEITSVESELPQEAKEETEDVFLYDSHDNQ